MEYLLSAYWLGAGIGFGALWRDCPAIGDKVVAAILSLAWPVVVPVVFLMSFLPAYAARERPR